MQQPGDYDAPVLVEAALGAVNGCEHADVRVVDTHTAVQSRRDRTAKAEVDHRSTALGVRVLRNGCWGFAATGDLSPDAAADAARRAVRLADITAPTVTDPVALAAEPVHVGSWHSDYDIDPFSLPATERMAFLQWGCDELLAAEHVDHADAAVMAVAETVHYADSAGTRTDQRRVRLQAHFTAVRVTDDGFTTMRTCAPPVGRGWEYLQPSGGGWDWSGELAAMPQLLAEKSTAPTVRPGSYTLVIDPTNLWLTIHESVAHATELDRIRGCEANYAGTSFVRESDPGSLRYGSALMNVRADRTARHGLATVAWDDEGVAAQEWPLISDGVLVGLQLDRAMAAAAGLSRSNGCAYADSAAHMPLQRMPNISLLPDPAGGSVTDLVGGVEDGIYVVGDNSWSIDMQRHNFQFTGQRFFRIRSGRLAGQLRDVAYQGRTTDFWSSLAALGGPQTYLLAGAFNCGKGQPGQVAPVSHGAPAAVFEAVNVLNSAEEAGA
jgi:TldD protein